MSQINFSDKMPKTRLIYLWTTLILVLFAGLSAVVYLLTGSQYILLLEIFSVVAVLFFVFSLVFLGIVYLSKPEAKQKRSLLSQLKKILGKLDRAQAELANALQLEEKIRQESRGKQEQERETLNNLLSENQSRLNAYKVAWEGELHQALEKLQLTHLEVGLKSNKLDPSDIPGIGEVLIDKLHAAGIQSAYDVNSEHIQSIPSFGESKALSLVRWRDVLESDLRKTQPVVLPDEKRKEIEENYTAKISRLIDEKDHAQQAFEQSLQEISSQEAEKVAAAVTTQTAVRQQLAELEIERQEIQAQVDLYDQITFRSMLSSALFTEPLNWQKRLFSFLIYLVYLVFGLINLAIVIFVWGFLRNGL